MLYTLQNNWLTVKMEDLGTQLASIQTPDGREFLWQGSPDSWQRRAPILFPIIGRLKDGCYQVDGTVYKISQHGFARDMVFEVVEQKKDSISFRISDTEETRKVYPFAFTLTVTYTLEENRIVKSHRVENRSDREMLYELGAHDGFQAVVPEDAIQLEGVDFVQLYGMDENNMLTPKNLEVPSKLPLTPMTFGRDTMIFDNAGPACLTGAQGNPKVTVTYEDFPYMGIWTPHKPFDTGFVCIEPWSTLPDGEFMGRELGDKPGIRRLAPGQSEVLTYTTAIHGGNEV